MKIGVISDTHLSAPTPALLGLSHGLFANVDMILHAGDLISPEVLAAFSTKQTFAVAGHCDPAPLRATLPPRQIISVNGYRIGLIHGHGRTKDIERRVLAQFEDVHCIVYGHTHRAVNHINSGVLLFNPGSFSGSGPFRRNRSVGILTIEDGISGSFFSESQWPRNCRSVGG